MKSKKPVNASKLYKVVDANWDETVCLNLAVALHYSRSAYRGSISFEAQQEACDFFNANGLDASLALITKLEKKSKVVF